MFAEKKFYLNIEDDRIPTKLNKKIYATDSNKCCNNQDSYSKPLISPELVSLSFKLMAPNNK